MSRILNEFAGVWQLERRIEQPGADPARFEGQAAWTPVPEGMRYHERGTLYLGPHKGMTAERNYLWDHNLNVYFDDGRFFHQVPAKGGGASHWCEPDQYEARYDFDNWPRWSCIWTVKGPRKDYKMHSEYSRR